MIRDLPVSPGRRHRRELLVISHIPLRLRQRSRTDPAEHTHIDNVGGARCSSSQATSAVAESDVPRDYAARSGDGRRAVRRDPTFGESGLTTDPPDKRFAGFRSILEGLTGALTASTLKYRRGTRIRV